MADYANETSGLTTSRPKTRSRKWLWIGVPVAIAVILAAVLGGVLGSRAHKHHNDNASADASTSSPTGEAAASQAASIKEAVGLYPTGTNSQYLLPLYPSTVCQPLLDQPARQ